jgi:molybdate transport system substrate-binding protein
MRLLIRLAGRLLPGLAILILPACGAGSAPGGSAQPQIETLTVLAAASLSNAFTQIGHRFEQAHPGTTVRFSFAGTQVLVTEIENGAPADVFASADAAHMAQLTGEGKVTGATVFAHNRLVLVTPRDNPAGLRTPFDLARAGVRLDVAAPQVPAGASAQKAIDRLAQQPGAPAGFADAVRRNVVSQEDNVEAVVTRLALGEADAGIVYASDLKTKNGRDLHLIAIPDAANVINSYPIGVVASTAQPDLARAFVAYATGPEAGKILRDAGFLTP